VISAGQSIEGIGVIEDRILVHGTLVGPSSTGGLNVFSGGSATADMVDIVDGTSGISGGQINAKRLSVLNGGAFTQSDGDVLVDGLRIGMGSTSMGTYALSDGSLSRVSPISNAYIVYLDSGTFLQSGGTNSVFVHTFDTLGGTTGSQFTYVLSGGTLTSTGSRFTIGDAGAATFSQTAGFASIANPRIALGAGTGYYSLSGTGSLTVSGILAVGSAGSGTFSQSGGTLDVNSILIKTISNGLGVFEKSDGQMTVTSLTNNGTFIHSGGTFAASTMSNAGTATLGGIQRWNSGATLINTGVATFTSNAGAAHQRHRHPINQVQSKRPERPEAKRDAGGLRGEVLHQMDRPFPRGAQRAGDLQHPLVQFEPRRAHRHPHQPGK
jgi:hypothetical protein